MKKKLILLIGALMFFIAISSVSACELIQEGTSERISNCRGSGDTNYVTDKWVNYQDDNGIWHHVNMTLIPSNTSWDYETNVGLYKAFFNKDFKRGTYAFQKNNYNLTVTLNNINILNKLNLQDGVVTNNKIEYDFLSNSSITYIAQPYKVKELIKISHDDIAPYLSLHLPLIFLHKTNPTKNLHIWVDGNEFNGHTITGKEIYLKDDNGKTILFFPKAYAYDSNGTEINLEYTLKKSGNNLFTEISVPYSFLNSAVYPIYIDPSTSLEESKGFIVGDTYTYLEYPDTNYGSSDVINVGRGNDNVYRGYININFSSLHAYSITSAEITMFQNYEYIGETTYYYYCDDSFNESNVTWNNQDIEITNCNSTPVITILSSQDTADDTWYTYNLTSVAQEELRKDGVFTLKGVDADESVHNVREYRSKENGSYAPYFTISYTTKPSDVNLKYFEYTSNLDISGQDTEPKGVFFKPDGTKMYLAGDGTNAIFQYTLSTPWDLSTASYDNISLNVNSQDQYPNGVFFKDDGSKMYMIGNDHDSVYQYTLSTPWDLSTASYDGVSFSVGSEETNAHDLFFKPDGTKLYITGTTPDTIFQYSLSTPWDISTASYDSKSFYVGDKDANPTGLFFSYDGTKLYMVGNDNTNKVYQYTLLTPWDLSTASYDGIYYDISGQASAATGMFLRKDGLFMYITDDSTDSIYQYTLYFSNAQTNSTSYGYIKHSVYVTIPPYDLSHYIFSFDNGSGTFVNDSAVAFPTGVNESWVNVTKYVNSSPIRWKVYVNNTNGDMKESPTYTYYPSLKNGNYSNCYYVFSGDYIYNSSFNNCTLIINDTGTTFDNDVFTNSKVIEMNDSFNTVWQNNSILNTYIGSINILQDKQFTNYTAPTLEATPLTFWLNFTSNVPQNVKFTWNTTDYNMSSSGNNHYINSLETPHVSSDTSYPYYYKWSDSYRNYTLSPFNILVYNLDIKNTATSGYTHFINNKWYDEQTMNQITGVNKSIIAYIVHFPNGDTQTFNFTETNINETNAYIYPNSSVRGLYQMDIQYTTEKSGYEKREYNIDNGTFNISQVANESLYLLNESSANVLKIKVTDWRGDPMSDVDIQVQRYYPDSNSYVTIASMSTDELGEAVAWVEYYNAYYRFIFSQNGKVLKTISKKVIIESPLEVQIGLEGEADVYQKIGLGNIQYTYHYDNKTITVDVIDPSGNVHGGNLIVWQKAMLNDTLICNKTGTGASFTLSCDIPDEDHLYLVYLTVHGSGNVNIFTKWLDFAKDTFGKEGLFATFLIVSVMLGVGLFNPVVSILLGIVGLVMSFLLGLILVNPAGIFSIVIVGIIMILVMRRKR